LTPELALTVPDEVAPVDASPRRTLNDLARGESGIVVGLQANPAFGSLDESVNRRLKELGFLPGTPVTLVAFGAFRREPLAVRVADSTFALRRQEAAKVIVEMRPQPR
jgi:ferrous iron transport protein A